MPKRTLTYLSDAGHAWLSVSLADIRALGLTEAISEYSYVNGTRAYLEEDCDAPRFLKRAREAGWHVHTKDTQCRAIHSWIRNLPRFTKWRVWTPIVSGSVLEVNNEDELYRVIGCDGKNWIVTGGKYARMYSLPVSNPFFYVTKVLS